MADFTLSDAAARYSQTVKNASRAISEINRFVRWYGPDRPLTELRGHEISLYADVLGPATPETSQRADYVRTFLTFLKKERLVESSLGPHLRLRKSAKTVQAPPRSHEEPVEVTREGIRALKKELESLKERRLVVREEIRKAMQDKDFRENAPLDAAKDKQGHQEARIREIESMLKRVVIADSAKRFGRVRVGCAVSVRNLATGALVRYSIVGPTEANAADGKISSVSPVGKALLDRIAGDEVEVSVPAGVMRLKVEDVES